LSCAQFTTSERRSRTVVAFALILPMIVCVVIGTFSVLAFRSSLQIKLFYTKYFQADILGAHVEVDDLDKNPLWHDYAPSIGSGIGGGLNATFIVLMNYLYAFLAGKLNDWENHRTRTDYEDALIVKTFAFQFINSYIALFYIAFIKAFRVNLLDLVRTRANRRQARACHPTPLHHSQMIPDRSLFDPCIWSAAGWRVLP
jgi:hypothetical protein